MLPHRSRSTYISSIGLWINSKIISTYYACFYKFHKINVWLVMLPSHINFWNCLWSDHRYQIWQQHLFVVSAGEMAKLLCRPAGGPRNVQHYCWWYGKNKFLPWICLPFLKGSYGIPISKHLWDARINWKIIMRVTWTHQPKHDGRSYNYYMEDAIAQGHCYRCGSIVTTSYINFGKRAR